MRRTSKRRAPRSQYTSTSQLAFSGFETPFYNQLDPSNRWVVLSAQVPWDDLVNIFNKRNPPQQTGRPALNPRVLIGAVVINHMLNLDDRETIAQITENHVSSILSWIPLIYQGSSIRCIAFRGYQKAAGAGSDRGDESKDHLVFNGKKC